MITKPKSKIKIHLFFYLITIISIITGNFKTFITFTTIILIHELGHIISAKKYKWNIDKILILPFGCLTIFKEKIDKPLKEEFIITIMGPIFQIIYYLIFKNHLKKSVQILNNLLLIFNLLPIYPLDGSKILNIALNKILPFKTSQKLTIYISIILIIPLFLINIYNFNLIIILTLIFLLIKIIEEAKNINNTFNKFLLEKYNYNQKYKKTKTIKGLKINKMYKNHNHLFYIDNTYKTEREIIKKRFDF